MRTMLRGKIHRATVTEADINYEGSVTLDIHLMEAADILPYEMVHILDVSNGVRLETYAIPGGRGTGEVQINGAAARLVNKGDIVLILVYEIMSDQDAHRHAPRLVYVDEENVITRVIQPEPAHA